MKDILNYFHSEEITNSGIIPRLASIKDFCEEKNCCVKPQRRRDTNRKHGIIKRHPSCRSFFLLKRERNLKAQL